MFKIKFLISSIFIIIFLLITSVIKNKTRIIENISSLNTKILIREKNISEAQMDFYYLTSPAELKKNRVL